MFVILNMPTASMTSTSVPVSCCSDHYLTSVLPINSFLQDNCRIAYVCRVVQMRPINIVRLAMQITASETAQGF